MSSNSVLEDVYQLTKSNVDFIFLLCLIVSLKSKSWPSLMGHHFSET